MIVKSKNTIQKKVGSMNINEYKINSHFSGALVMIDGDHGAIRCLHEDRLYFIVEGQGIFIINNRETAVSSDDLVFIPKNTPYNIIGKLKYFLICSPEFNPDDDVFLK
jgi:mannose-6-phosphate isomerase-like protein (cupin superfamily)